MQRSLERWSKFMNSWHFKTISITLIMIVFPSGILFAADRVPQEISWDFLIIGLLGGLALFLYGMEKMSEGMKKSAGNKMRSVPPSISY